MYIMLVWWLTQGVVSGTWVALCAHETLQTLNKQQWSCPVAPIKNLDAFYKGSPAFWKDYIAEGYDHSRLAGLQNISMVCHTYTKKNLVFLGGEC